MQRAAAPGTGRSRGLNICPQYRPPPPNYEITFPHLILPYTSLLPTYFPLFPLTFKLYVRFSRRLFSIETEDTVRVPVPIFGKKNLHYLSRVISVLKKLLCRGKKPWNLGSTCVQRRPWRKSARKGRTLSDSWTAPPIAEVFSPTLLCDGVSL
jgi:hypothetical protein